MAAKVAREIAVSHLTCNTPLHGSRVNVRSGMAAWMIDGSLIFSLTIWSAACQSGVCVFILYSARPFIRKSNSSIILKIRHIHWELGKPSVYFALKLSAPLMDSFPKSMCTKQSKQCY